jgi:hypothetical protein
MSFLIHCILNLPRPNLDIHFYTSPALCLVTKLAHCSVYVWGWSGSKSTITETIHWPIAPALGDRLR